MTDTPSWLVRLTYKAPAPDDRNGRLIDYCRLEELTEHAAAHARARSWANQTLPAGAVLDTVEITIEERRGAQAGRVEHWQPGRSRSVEAEALDHARRTA